MAEIHKTTLTPTKLELLTAWMPQQRWFAAKGAVPVLRKLGGYRLDDPAGEVGIEVMIVADDGGASPVVYQVPLTYRGSEAPELAHALVGTSEHGVLGTRWIYDAPHDHVFVAQLLNLITGDAQAQAQSVSNALDPEVVGHALASGKLWLTSQAVLKGEQSNTSVICQVLDGGPSGDPLEPVIVKIFRVLAQGANPDVVVAGALTQAGSPYVPAVRGEVEGHWPDQR